MDTSDIISPPWAGSVDEWIFEVQDRDDNWVRLKADRWELHITTKHREVEPYVEEIREVIKLPAIITENKGGSIHLARLGAVGGRWEGLYLEVVVRYNKRGDAVTGSVLTVHFNAMPPKGELKWIERH